MLQKFLKRMKNPKIFIAVVSGITMILVNLGVIDMSVAPKVEEITNLILSIGVAIGIFTSPDVEEN